MTSIQTWFSVAKNVVTDFKTKFGVVTLAAGACAALAAGPIVAVGTLVAVGAVGLAASMPRSIRVISSSTKNIPIASI